MLSISKNVVTITKNVRVSSKFVSIQNHARTWHTNRRNHIRLQHAQQSSSIICHSTAATIKPWNYQSIIWNQCNSMTSVRYIYHPQRQPVTRRWFFWSINSSSEGNDDSGTEVLKSTTMTKKASDHNNNDDDGICSKTITSTWNISGLRNEMFRRMDRLHKKIGQYNKRIEKYNTDRGGAAAAATQSMNEQIDIDAVKVDLLNAQATLKRLRELDELLSNNIASSRGDMVLPENIAMRAIALNMTDTPPPRPPRGGPKAKGPRKMEPSRKPYRIYTSIDNIEIRVGKKAEDNDELSTNPEHRDSTDWWLHAAGCPGSHVIIRNDNPPDDTIQDAAVLAANKSKCTGTTIQVNMCQARYVKKPPFAKPGLVLLQGNVRTVTVDMKAAQKRLQRLESTVNIN